MNYWQLSICKVSKGSNNSNKQGVKWPVKYVKIWDNTVIHR